MPYERFIVPGLITMAMAQAGVVLLLVGFSALGVVVGLYARHFDHHAFINNLVILPLAFLGGVFYSVDSLPSPWEGISHVNPVFYVVQAGALSPRSPSGLADGATAPSSGCFGFLGTADAPVGLSLLVCAVVAAIAVGWSSWLFRTGRRLKP